MNKTKVGYYCADVNPLNTRSLGIYKMTREILKQLEGYVSLEITLILSRESEYYFREFTCKKVICESGKSRVLNKLFVYPAFANETAEKNGLHVLFFPKGHIPFVKNRGTKYISIINDLIPIYYLKRGNLFMLASSFLLLWAAKRSDKIITISEYSKAEISKITNQEISVIPLGCRQVKPMLPKEKESFVFVVGNKNHHKNLGGSIRFVEEYNISRGTNFRTIYSLGGLTEEELAGYYKTASFSVFLSTIEGFGLPLIESYAYGTPVVFNDKTSLAEIGKGLPGACNIEKRESVFKAMDEVALLDKRRIAEISAQLLRKYNWTECGEAVARTLQSF